MVDKKKFFDELDEYIKDKKQQHDEAEEYNHMLHKKSAVHYVEELKTDKKSSYQVLINKITKLIKKINLKNQIDKVKSFAKKESKAVSDAEKDFVADTQNIFHKLKTASIKDIGQNLSAKDKMKISLAGLIAIGLVIGGVSINNVTSAYAVSYKGAYIGVINQQNEVINQIEHISTILRNEYDAEVVISEDNFSFEKVRQLKFAYMTQEELLGHFIYAAGVDVQGYALMVNEEQLAFFAHKDEADLIIDDLKSAYLDTEDDLIEYKSIGFVENVTIAAIENDIEEVTEYDAILEYILRGTNETRTHKVKKGENYWTIADQYNIKPNELEDANPKVDPTRLQIGQEISLIVPKPLVTVVTKENETYFTRIQYEVDYENTSALFKGETAVKIRGKYGEREIVAEVERQNGIETNRTELTSTIIKDPKTQTVLVGTKALPPLIGTGTFDKPTRGTVTSRYGMRWGSLHTGIDIAAPLGTTLRAADGGVVTYAGWKGNYGLLVIIDHGQNKSTYYAHCNKILVSKGEKIYKGQKIAEMGSTGKSTGPHIHFEIRINGVPTNPQNYLSF